MPMVASIERKQGVCGGSPVISGTRIRVSHVVRYQRLFGNTDNICKAYRLEPEQVKAAFDFYDQNRNEIDKETREEDEAFENLGPYYQSQSQ